MARELVLITKTKYDRLIGENDKPDEIDSINKPDKIEIEKPDENNEQKKNDINQPSEAENEERQTKQKGGKLALEGTPERFMNNLNKSVKRKWLSFKV